MATFLFVLASMASASFVTFQGDNQRTGNMSGTGPVEPNLLWSTSLTGHGYVGASAAVSGDQVFVSNWPDMTFKGELGLACLNRADGKRLWLNPLGSKGGASTPALADGMVFVGSLTGNLYCVDAETGETIWNKTIERDPKWWGVTSSPLVQNGVVYIMSFSDGTLHALGMNGEEMWNRSTGQISAYVSAASLSGKLYFPGGDPALYCVDLVSKEVLWKTAVSSQISATPTLGENEVFFVTKESVQALDAASGKQIWTAKVNGSISSPAVSSGRVYVGSDDQPKGHISCFDARNGSLIWRTEVNGPVKSSPLVLDDRVYFGTNSEEGAIYALDAGNGSIVWSYPVGAFIMSSASASDGVLFMGADDGRMYAFSSLPKGLLWDGEVLLEEESFNLTASSGKSYRVNQSTALGALVKAADQNGLNFSINDSLYNLYGLQVESLGGYSVEGDKSWRFWINYPKEAMPASGSDLVDLRDNDRVLFYFGDRRARPEDSPRLEISSPGPPQEGRGTFF